MAGRSQQKEIKEFKHDREIRADYDLSVSKGDSGDREEASAPYKLEPSPTEIEDFLTRLRQEGL